MTPRQMHRLLDALEHALADLPPEVREPVDVVLSRLAGAFLERVAECERLRRLQALRSYRRLWQRVREEVSAS